jgi:hypothetical protein
VSARRPRSDRSRQDAAPRRRGADAVDVTFPTLRGSCARGFVTAVSNPALVVGVPLVLVLEWLVLISLGFQGPFVVLVHALAPPPVGTIWDVNVSVNLSSTTWIGLLGIGVAVVFRAVIVAVVAAIAVRTLRGEAVDRWVWVPALRALPACLAVSVSSLGLIYAQALLGAVLGSAVGGIAQLILIGTLVLGVSYFGFAPAIAVSEDRRLADTLTRAWRAARIPGSGNITLAALYVLPAYALLLAAPVLPGGAVGVNPPAGAWAFIVMVNLIHVAIMSMYAYRYLAIADAVPDAPLRRAPARQAAARRRR